MVGCGGLGPANAGAVTMASAAAKALAIAAAVGIEVDLLKSILPFLLTLHDIGKYSRVFQSKSPNHWPTTSLGVYRAPAPGNNHVITGFQLLVALSDDGSCRDVVETVMPGWSASERKILFSALAGHHGRPPEEAARRSLGPHDACDICVGAAQAHIQAMFSLFRPAALPRRPPSSLTLLGVGIAGLFVLADWIGSAETWFPYIRAMEGDETFERYWHHAQHAAARAVDEAGVSPAEVEHFGGMSQLFPEVRTRGCGGP